MNKNIDTKVVESFGKEWSSFDQSELDERDYQAMFDAYFSIFPWGELPPDSIGFDLGCGSGRWAKRVAPRVGKLHCIDPSNALDIAKKNLMLCQNCCFHLAGVDNIPLEDESADFGYSLGVLHHIPDTKAGLKNCVAKLKRGAPFLLYLYYAFDNKPKWWKALWKMSEVGRFLISRTPYPLRYIVTQIIAALVYWPLAKLALLVEWIGFEVESFPLSYYRKLSFYVMRTDALDRFGTQLEKRFTKNEIEKMMEDAGLERITFSNQKPYWTTLGYKR